MCIGKNCERILLKKTNYSKLINIHEFTSSFFLFDFCRGIGLFIGIELSEDRASKKPATEQAKRVAYK